MKLHQFGSLICEFDGKSEPGSPDGNNLWSARVEPVAGSHIDAKRTAALIVRAVNHHEEQADMIRRLLEITEMRWEQNPGHEAANTAHNDVIRAARNLLAKVKS